MAAPAPMPQPTQYVGDQNVEGVREEFERFLLNFSPAGYDPAQPMADEDAPPAPSSFMAQQVLKMCADGETTLYIEYAHLREHNAELADKVVVHFERAEPVLRKTLQDHVRAHHNDQLMEMHGVEKEFFIGITGLAEMDTLRDLKTEKIGRLVAFSGTVTRTTEVRPELFLGTFRCNNCATVMTGVEQQHKFTQPLICTNTGCNNKVHFTLQRDNSTFVDWQRVKVQENVDEIPGGSLPRMMDVILRSNTVDKAKPGDRVTFTGSLAVCPDVSVMATPGDKVTMKPAVSQAKDAAAEGVTGLKTLGVREMTYKLIFMACSATQTSNKGGMVSIRSDNDTQKPQEVLEEYSPEAQQKVLDMAADPDVFMQLARSVCPSVFGHEHIKQAILLMLLGGVHKRTKEGINLRGDINVAIIGDPSCAKSQLLKWVAGFLPRAVYTSGKASTAAGLTASVVKEPENNEFAIEAGALMLADNGICCIDEFDKMDSKDQVAIHEAMEQQTISIAKAGIQATLNARASILAAANPLGGRYDKSKPLKWNIALPPAILSRFDLLHVMIDETTEYQDERIAAHIVALHRFPGATLASNAPYTSEEMQRYIRYTRAIKPVISAEAQEALVKAYIRLRGEDAVPGSASAYRITVRQLEALVRLSEAMARAYCCNTIRVAHVREASKLLQSSIMKIEQGDVDLEELLGGGDERDGAMEDWLEDHQLPHAPADAEPMDADAGAVQADDAENNPAAANMQQQPQPGAAGEAGGAEKAEGGEAAKPSTAVKISAEKYEYVKNMLLGRLQQEQEEQAASEAAAAAASAMDVDGSAADEASLQRAGMRQQALAEWYMEKQISRDAITTIEQGEDEYRLVFRVINHLIKKERLITVLSAAVRRNEGEGEQEYRNRLWKERILALSAGYVAE